MPLTAYFSNADVLQQCRRNVRKRCGSLEYRHQYKYSPNICNSLALSKNECSRIITGFYSRLLSCTL